MAQTIRVSWFALATLLSGLLFFCFLILQSSNTLSSNEGPTLRYFHERTKQAANQPIRVLFFGQSISKQDWWLQAANSIRDAFPGVDFWIENRAIGGHSAERLKWVVEANVAAFQPDLIVFHVYGRSTDYEQIIRSIRQNTVADLLVATDHLLSTDELLEEVSSVCLTESDLIRKVYSFAKNLCGYSSYLTWFNLKFIPALSSKYGFTILDVRKAWKDEIAKTSSHPQNFLADSVHLNDRGNRLMATIFHDEFNRKISEAGAIDAQVSKRHFGVTAQDVDERERTIQLPNGIFRLDFESKECTSTVSKPQATVEPNDPQTSYWASPSSVVPKTDFPSLLRVDFGNTAPKIGRWTIIIREVSAERDRWNFDMFDPDNNFVGAGSSIKEFLSADGAIVLKPEYWNLHNAFVEFKIALGVGESIHWTIKRDYIESRGPKNLQLSDENKSHHRVYRDTIRSLKKSAGCKLRVTSYANRYQCNLELLGFCLDRSITKD
jgi:hypothetical protein